MNDGDLTKIGTFPSGHCHTLVPPWLTELLPSAQILIRHGVDRCWINMGVTNATTASVTASVMKKNDRLNKRARVRTQTHEAAKHGNRSLDCVHTEVGRAAHHLLAIPRNHFNDHRQIIDPFYRKYKTLRQVIFQMVKSVLSIIPAEGNSEGRQSLDLAGLTQ